MRELNSIEVDAACGAGNGQQTGDAVLAVAAAVACMGPEALPVAACIAAFGAGLKLTSN
ncbi:MAG TPA: hypothetical protein VGI95_09955 [Caulobacteraceae bacterium]|jgi:hypothetical protein